MGTAGFKAAIDRGEPLADVVVKFRTGVDGVSATERINALADDFDLHPRPWYDAPLLRVGSATRNALDRLFGWQIKRAPLPSDPRIYRWEEVMRPNRFPPGLETIIESMGLTQPGADDDGQFYEHP